MITIIDYNAGNLASVYKALKFIGCDCKVSNKPIDIINAEALILPGVGAFAHAVSSMKSLQLDKHLKEYLNTGKPFLGICLGLQLLFEESEESPNVHGLGILKGRVKRFPESQDFKVPHMGWNSLNIKAKDGIFKDLPDNPYVYFVHSYYLDATDKSIVSSQTQYSTTIDSSIQAGNIIATQFHPEKSGDVGIKMLKNFCNIVKKGRA